MIDHSPFRAMFVSRFTWESVKGGISFAKTPRSHLCHATAKLISNNSVTFDQLKRVY